MHVAGNEDTDTAVMEPSEIRGRKVTIIGAAMMISGLGMGVTMILIPVGVPVGLVGLGIFLWGVWGFREARRKP